MASELNGMRVAFLTANEGVEQVELTAPWQAVKDADGTPELLAPRAGEVQGFDHVDKADTFTVHRSIRDADPLDYSALVLPGGVVNADELRMVPAAVTYVHRIFEAGQPAAVICHARGPWLRRAPPSARPLTPLASPPGPGRAQPPGPGRAHRRAGRHLWRSRWRSLTAAAILAGLVGAGITADVTMTSGSAQAHAAQSVRRNAGYAPVQAYPPAYAPASSASSSSATTAAPSMSGSGPAYMPAPSTPPPATMTPPPATSAAPSPSTSPNPSTSSPYSTPPAGY